MMKDSEFHSSSCSSEEIEFEESPKKYERTIVEYPQFIKFCKLSKLSCEIFATSKLFFRSKKFAVLGIWIIFRRIKEAFKIRKMEEENFGTIDKKKLKRNIVKIIFDFFDFSWSEEYSEIWEIYKKVDDISSCFGEIYKKIRTTFICFKQLSWNLLICLKILINIWLRHINFFNMLTTVFVICKPIKLFLVYSFVLLTVNERVFKWTFLNFYGLMAFLRGFKNIDEIFMAQMRIVKNVNVIVKFFIKFKFEDIQNQKFFLKIVYQVLFLFLKMIRRLVEIFMAFGKIMRLLTENSTLLIRLCRHLDFVMKENFGKV
ncbi:hypothetical protein EDEG_01300 [Edhazardia aedis USNM 41457]|uniref:Uncharacterized protein n=1 Tax=Edhazardia aedis (strain USNM 41457) TaxID=1003232 RepID=J8ZXS2_EDHAE|nr:hypothetical protein EDEG_01300 [Edhazardia aedis USNM 41457]|eukprot:EJW04483.1 hypothetical protein EDEG_01300 [Edhazardia aedis USNM 41457]